MQFSLKYTLEALKVNLILLSVYMYMLLTEKLQIFKTYLSDKRNDK